MLSLLRVIPLVTVLICFVGASVADARRPATDAEKHALVPRVPPECQTAYISTIDPRYASSQWNENGGGCLRYAGNGIGLYTKRDGQWTYVSGMSDCTPIGMEGVPDRVYRELTRAYCSWCPRGRSGVENLRANGPTCGSARRVARRWVDSVKCPTKGHCTFRISGVLWGCRATQKGLRSDVSCNPYARPTNVHFVFTAPAPHLTDDEAVDQILRQLTDDGAIASIEEDVQWNDDPCERVSTVVVVCTYWYTDGQGRWEGRTRVRETLDGYWLKDEYVESRP